MKKLLLFLFITASYLQITAQEHAWVYLKDKPSEASYFASPLTMLSQRALDRRTTQNIVLDSKDVPIEASYYNQINTISGITILAKSKWMNAIHVLGDVDDINALTTTYTFIESIEFANDALNLNIISKETSKTKKVTQHKTKKSKVDLDYGNATHQIEMLGGDVLHENGFTGEGMHIAVIDAGFPNVNTLAAFSKIRENNQILGGYDFVDRNEDFYSGGSHGTNVLSDIAGYLEGNFIGTAPDASFYLFRTEDDDNETPLEESLWVEAAERADSLGVNIVNTSLGYTDFDNSDYDYTYNDMDGETTFISRGAEIAASRGMLMVMSAGNSGNTSWKYITAPADAASVFSVGAVNADEEIASFSSFGPTVDGRVKPDVLAQGASAYVISSITGNPITSNGTSFSAPIMTGVIACFWQAFPDKTNMEIMQLIRESADRYNNPTDQYGYGIPDFEIAYSSTLSLEREVLNDIIIYPNPVRSIMNVDFLQNEPQSIKINIYNFLGEKISFKKEVNNNQLDVSDLKTGIYFLRLSNGGKEEVLKFLKE